MTLYAYWDVVNLRFTEHLRVVDNDPYNNNRWRWGQTCMNVLYDERPDLWRAIAQSDLDPWDAEVSSPTYARFCNYITEHWDA